MKCRDETFYVIRTQDPTHHTNLNNVKNFEMNFLVKSFRFNGIYIFDRSSSLVTCRLQTDEAFKQIFSRIWSVLREPLNAKIDSYKEMQSAELISGN